MCICISLICSQAVPLHCFPIVLGDTITIVVAFSQSVLRRRISLICSQAVPLHCFIVILCHTVTLVITIPQVALCICISLVCSQAVPLHCLTIVRGYAIAIIIAFSQIILCYRKPLISCPMIHLDGFLISLCCHQGLRPFICHGRTPQISPYQRPAQYRHNSRRSDPDQFFRLLLGFRGRLRLWLRFFRFRIFCFRLSYLLSQQSYAQLVHGLQTVFGNHHHSLLQGLPGLGRKLIQCREIPGKRVLVQTVNGIRGQFAGKGVVNRSRHGIDIRPGAGAAPLGVLFQGTEAAFRHLHGGSPGIDAQILGRSQVQNFHASIGQQHDVVRA